ncbi:MAG: helicase-associated domain-containing protein [Deltaproteobacteria bacterium]|nr:helicase-associated domain-containing protein [Deltaproteobacteria bacterium]
MPTYFLNPICKTLEEALLNTYKADALKALAKLVCHKIPNRKADIVRAICGVMLSFELKTHFDKLNPIEKATVQEALFAPDGILDKTQFKAKYQEAPPLGRSMGWRAKGHLVDLFVINRHVPEDLKKRLKAFVKAPKEDDIRHVDKLPEVILLDIEEKTVERDLFVRNTAAAALNNLETVLRLVEGGKIKVSAKTGRPPLASQKILGKLLQDGDWYKEEDIHEGIGYIQAFAWPVLLQGTGLAKADGSALKLTNKGKKALKGNFPKVIKEAWSRWQSNKFLDEFSRVDKIKGQTASRHRALFPASTRRPALYEGLLLCTPGKWLTAKELIRSMLSKGFDFELARYAWKLYVGDAQYGHLDEYGDQTMIKMRYVLAYLFEYAATLGIVDVAYIYPDGALSDYRGLWGWGMDDTNFLSRYDGLTHIRINALGAFAMEMTDTYDAGPQKSRAVLTVLPNHDVVVTDAQSLSPADKLFLEKSCRKKSSAVWKLTTRTLLEAAQNGTTIEEIRTFLESRSAQPIPDTVRTLLNDTKKRSTGFEYAGRTHLVACKDTLVQKLVTTDAKLSKLCRPAGETHIVILPGKEKQFMTALLRLGYIVPQLREQI